MKDRDDLRFTIFKNGEDVIHIGVNVPRLFWNAKQKFSILPSSKSDLHPNYILDQLRDLIQSISVIPGVKLLTDPLTKEANENSKWLFSIYLR